jgi:hypothetical protein
MAMKTMNSISGGQTSAYVAAHYPADYDVFALVRVEDERLRPKDKKLVQEVEARTGKEFIGTTEEPIILRTMLDLEQHIGRRIHWVAGDTFEHVIHNMKYGYLPNITARYCTTHLKLQPIFEFWLANINEPVETRIGYRHGEQSRADTMLAKTDEHGLTSFRHGVRSKPGGRRKWYTTPWQKPVFPLLEGGIRRDQIVEYWRGSGVRFAVRNNCVGCFHRSPMLLNAVAQQQPKEFQWFVDMEKRAKGQWRKDTTYEAIQKFRSQHALSFDDFSDCDSGYCGL